MATIYSLKSKFQDLLRPLTKKLVSAGVTANQVTISTMLASMIIGAGLWFFHDSPAAWLILPIFLFVRMAANAIDGMIAREHNQCSNKGAFLNELGDVISDWSLYLPCALLLPENLRWLAWVSLALMALVELAGLCAIQVGASRRYDGPCGKSDRAFAFGVLSLAIVGGYYTVTMGVFFFAIINFFLVLTLFNRYMKADREVKAS